MPSYRAKRRVYESDYNAAIYWSLVPSFLCIFSVTVCMMLIWNYAIYELRLDKT